MATEYINREINLCIDCYEKNKQISNFDEYDDYYLQYGSFDFVFSYINNNYNENDVIWEINTKYKHLGFILNNFLNDDNIDNENKIEYLKGHTTFSLNAFLLAYAKYNDPKFKFDCYNDYIDNYQSEEDTDNESD